MKLIRGICNLNKTHYKCILTIGNFDGMHRGHQSLLHKLKKESLSKSLPIMAIIFEPQPLEFFFKEKAPARLTNLREKLIFLKKYGVDYVLCIRFEQQFAALTAKSFVEDFLIKRLGIRFLVVGDDFRFGAGRHGDLHFLKKYDMKYGFSVLNTKTCYEGKIRISSTIIRQSLENDELKVAKNLLGYPFFIFGRVIYGNGIGRTIGFPTANLLLRNQVLPVKGVYVVKVTIMDQIIISDKMLFFGIANIGIRPTVKGVQPQLEVHLLDTVINLYGRYIKVVFLKKIRNERRFSLIEELKVQIAHDELKAKEFLGIKT